MLFAFAAGKLNHNRSQAKNGRAAGLFLAYLFFISACAIPHRAFAREGLIDLKPANGVGGQRQVRVVVESEGKLKLNADGQEVKHLPLKVEGDLAYAERVLAQAKNWTETRVVRAFSAGGVKIRLHESDLTHTLRPDRRVIVVESAPAESLTFCPAGPLTREELELIETPASGVAPEALLSPRAVKVGSQWPLSEAIVARLLGLEAVSQQDVVASLESAKDGVALITFAGKVAGAVGGVSSDSELKGKLNFDLQRHAVTWLTMAVKENRAIGHAQPGYEVVTTVRMVLQPVPAAAEVSDKALAGLKLKAGSGEKLLEMTSDAGAFQLHHDRRWSVMLERPDLTVLRFVDRGDLIAQCNISPRPALAADQQLSMEGFQAEVKRVLGNNFEEIVEATEETDDAGRRLLRVVVAGKAGELPIQWMYYELADSKGRRVALVFTLEASLLERFAALDRELIGGLEFRPEKEPTRADGKSAKSVRTDGAILR